ncbi:MAG: hypothetical protein ACP5VE_08365 [Chthonomonadales bacterium]
MRTKRARTMLTLVWAMVLAPSAWGQPAPAPASGEWVTDIFVGRNVVGPYLLTWRGIDAGTVTVYRDGMRLVAGLDYTLNAVAGVITFTAPLRANQIVRVDYLCVPGRALKNTTVPSIPVELRLLQRGDTSLSLNAIYRPSIAPEGGATGGLMLLGLGGNTRIAGGSNLTTKFYLDARGGSILERSGLAIGGTTRASFGTFSASLVRAGEDFVAMPDAGIIPGRQVAQASAMFKPVLGIAASASFSQTVDLSHAGAGATVTTWGGRLAGGLFGGLRFQTSRMVSITSAADGTAAARTTDRVELNQKIGASTQAAAVIERSQTDAGKDHAVAQTSTLSVRAQPTEALAVSGTVQNRILPTGVQDASDLRLDARLTPRLTLSATAADRSSPTMAEHQRSAGLQYTPSRNLSLSGDILVQSRGRSELLAGGLMATARPFPQFELSGGVRIRDASVNGLPDPSIPDTYDLKLAWRVWRDALHLTAGYADNPDDGKGQILRTHNRSLGFESRLGHLDVAGNYTLQIDDGASAMRSVSDLKLGWRFAPTTSLVTSFREALTRGTGLDVEDTVSIGFAHRIASELDLSLSGAVTTYERDGVFQPNRDYRAEAKLALRF